ncbi:CCHC-type domain-containing protein [Trichonephila clavipes]|uniref:CCHC-type domain-containing protein n=1 Tax=Trichonephila clavipes TaxID=2585209 RepID=A0A8X7B7G1_TRICX|nr:CCHC-type domain-containing protein [Trichonephila clavipes]
MRLQKRKVDGYEWRCRNQSKDNRHDVVRSGKKETLEWCMKANLIASRYECPRCKKNMRLQKRKVDGYEWRCRNQSKDNRHDVVRKSIIREVRSNLTPLTREKPAPSPYRTERTGESSWRPRSRPRQENRPTQQDIGRKTDLWRTSDNVPSCFHCGRPGHVTRYWGDRRRVFSAARQRRQLDQHERWDSDSVSHYGRDPESNYQRYRSNSPYPRRNPQRHHSRSPSRRSSCKDQ